MGSSHASLYAALVIASIGFGLLTYGRQQRRIPQLVAGMGLIAYPFFVDGLGWMIGIGVGVVAALVLLVRAGL